jgi:hypothetical protein
MLYTSLGVQTLSKVHLVGVSSGARGGVGCALTHLDVVPIGYGFGSSVY